MGRIIYVYLRLAYKLLICKMILFVFKEPRGHSSEYPKNYVNYFK